MMGVDRSEPLEDELEDKHNVGDTSDGITRIRVYPRGRTVGLTWRMWKGIVLINVM